MTKWVEVCSSMPFHGISALKTKLSGAKDAKGCLIQPPHRRRALIALGLWGISKPMALLQLSIKNLGSTTRMNLTHTLNRYEWHLVARLGRTDIWWVTCSGSLKAFTLMLSPIWFHRVSHGFTLSIQSSPAIGTWSMATLAYPQQVSHRAMEQPGHKIWILMGLWRA